MAKEKQNRGLVAFVLSVLVHTDFVLWLTLTTSSSSSSFNHPLCCARTLTAAVVVSSNPAVTVILAAGRGTGQNPSRTGLLSPRRKATIGDDERIVTDEKEYFPAGAGRGIGTPMAGAVPAPTTPHPLSGIPALRLLLCSFICTLAGEHKPGCSPPPPPPLPICCSTFLVRHGRFLAQSINLYYVAIAIAIQHCTARNEHTRACAAPACPLDLLLMACSACPGTLCTRRESSVHACWTFVC